VSYWLLQLRAQFLPVFLPVDVVIDVRVLAFTTLLAVATAVLFGLGPALAATRNASVHAPFERPRRGRARVALVALQAALSLALLGTGVQFMRTVQEQTGIRDFADPGRHLVARFDLSKLRFSELQAAQFFDELLRRTGTLTAVEAAGGTSFDLVSGQNGIDALLRVWLPSDIAIRPRDALGGYASGDIFQAVGLRLLAGRTFTDLDGAGRPSVAVVDEKFAAQLFGGDAIGQRVRVGRARDELASSHEVTIVGVVQGRSERLPMVFLPARLGSAQSLIVHLQARGDAATAADGLRRLVREVDNRVPVQSLMTAQEIWRLQNSADDLIAGSVTALGIMALLLATGGLYAVVSFLVAAREKEIGIRMSLGATSTSVVGMIVRQALLPSLVGCALGALGATLVGQVLRARLYGSSPVDAAAMVAAAAVLLGSLLLASTSPARRAARVDPLTVLRRE
jgi:putative ABC transport system permease protein